MVMMDTSGTSRGTIQEGEIFRVVAVPDATGNGWTIGAGRK
jgi:hypothetical protein